MQPTVAAQPTELSEPGAVRGATQPVRRGRRVELSAPMEGVGAERGGAAPAPPLPCQYNDSGRVVINLTLLLTVSLTLAIPTVLTSLLLTQQNLEAVPRLNQKGVVERDGTPKESYYVFQSYWAEKPMIHIYGHT